MSQHYSTVQVQATALRHNYCVFKELVPQKKLVAVVKANAYGHGVEPVVQALADLVWGWQVDSVSELELVRRWSDKPVWVLGYVPRSQWRELLQYSNVTLSLYSYEQFRQWQLFWQQEHSQANSELAKNKPIDFHLKIDTGFGRLGVLPSDLPLMIEQLRSSTAVHLSGVYTHFGQADEANLNPTWKQVARFEQCLLQLHTAGWEELQVHMSSTSGAISLEQHQFESSTHVRLGLGLYGLWPSEFLKKQNCEQLSLQPAMRWITQVAQIKTLPPNWPVAYGATYITAHPTRVAILPVGYADGYDRLLSNRGEVLIHGYRCLVIGRVMMNMIVVDLSVLPESVKVNIGDEVVLIGQQGKQQIVANELADHAQTINYEVVTRVSALLPRELI